MKNIAVIGGANIDYYAKSVDSIIPQDSNNGTLNKAFGGVGRNIAETLGRLGLTPVFISAFSIKDEGALLLKHLKTHGVDVHYTPLKKTSAYLAVIDIQNDLYVGINDMQAMEDALNPQVMQQHKEQIEQCKYIVVEPNLSRETLTYLFNTYRATFIVDGISTVKVNRIKPFLPKIHILKVNRQEAETLLDCRLTDNDAVRKAVLDLLMHGVNHVFITLGAQGVFYGQGTTVVYRKSTVEAIKNTTGAGDAFLAGVIYAETSQNNLVDYGMAASKITLQSEHSVSEVMNKEHLINTVRRLKYESKH